MQDSLNTLEQDALKEVEQAFTPEQIEHLRIYYLGKKGRLAELMQALKALPSEQKPAFGAKVNQLKNKIQFLLEEKSSESKAQSRNFLLAKERIDVTLPGGLPASGRTHPLTQTLDGIQEFFEANGFQIAEGPEVETEYYNFEALNIPAQHPARDMWDTLFLGENSLLRTHTSPVQIRYMEKHKPPLRILAPGRVYRRDQVDASHSPFFHQVEGLVIESDIQFSHLKGIIEAFLHHIFQKGLKVKFSPSFFPFTEPSAEVGMECFCHGNGCNVCKGSGWLEVLGCGMVHPKVLSRMGLNPEEWNGFAFGMGLDRITMLKYGIPDLRLLFENNASFLKQF